MVLSRPDPMIRQSDMHSAAASSAERVPARHLILLLSLIAVAAAAVSIFAILEVNAVAGHRAEVDHTYEVRRSLRELSTAMYAAEAAARAGREDGGDRLAAQIDKAQSALAEFRYLSQDNAVQQAAARVLATELEEYLSDLSEASARIPPQDRFRHIARAQADVSGQIDRALAEEARLLAVRLATTRKALRQSQRLFVGGSILALAALLAALYLAVRQLRRRRISEEELRARTHLLSATFRAMGQGVLVLDAGMRVMAVNPWLRRTFALPDDLDLGRATYADLLQIQASRGQMRPEDVDRRIRDMRAMIDARAPCKSEYLLGDGRTIEIDRRPYGDGGLVSTYTDVTDRRQAERRKNEFISTVSHELRTPLTSIRGSLGLIAGGAVGAVPQKVREMVAIAHSNSERLVRLINDMLDIEKIESGRLPFDVRPHRAEDLVLQAIQANAGYFAQYDVRATLANGVPGAVIRVDGDRFAQVLSNLLSNAAKHTPAGGEVSVTLARAGGRVRLSVKDDGPGIPEEFRSRIFGKFEQADSSDARRRDGTGLGLHIVKAIVDRLDGRIWFDSEVGIGTTFHVELPEAPVAEPAAAEAGAAAPAGILVVEDDPDVARLLSMMLAANGWAVTVAHSAAAAMPLLESGRFAAMTLDIMLPDEDGLSFFRRLRLSPATRMLPVVVVSAKAGRAREELNGDAIGIVDWLEKPIDQDRLGRAIRHALGAGGGPASILHVEDDPDIVRVVGAVMGDEVEVVPAASLAAARAALRQRAFSLVIVDVGLPDGSGLDLLDEIRRINPPPPVVIFSAGDLDDAVTTDVAAALVKSRTDNAALYQTIHRLIGRAAGAPGPSAEAGIDAEGSADANPLRRG